jgi:hypothetical protein
MTGVFVCLGGRRVSQVSPGQTAAPVEPLAPSTRPGAAEGATADVGDNARWWEGKEAQKGETRKLHTVVEAPQACVDDLTLGLVAVWQGRAGVVWFGVGRGIVELCA